MTLAADAKELTECLNLIVAGLESYKEDSRSEYTSRMAEYLKPLVTSFNKMVSVDRSKELAELKFDEINDLMHNINGAYTKGEIYFVEEGVLEKYWQYCSIFQESKDEYKSL